MLNKKNIAIAMAAATAATPFATMTTIFADVVDNTQEAEIKALKESVYELLNAKYTTNHNLLADEVTPEATAEELAGSRVYSEVKITVGGNDPVAYKNYADFEKAFDKAFAEMKNGEVLKIDYISDYGVRKLDDGTLLNSNNVKYESATKSDFVTEVGTLAADNSELATYLDAEVVVSENVDGSFYAKVPVSNGYLTVKKGNEKLDLAKPKFKVVDGYYVDAKGNSIKKFEPSKECLAPTVTELIALGGVVEGYYPEVTTTDVNKSKNTIAIVKKSTAETKEELKVSDLYEASAGRLTVRGNEIAKAIKDIVADETALKNKDNLRARVVVTDKAGQIVKTESVEVGNTNTETGSTLTDMANAITSDAVKVKIIIENTKDENNNPEWNTLYEGTITAARGENLTDVAKVFNGSLIIDTFAGMDRYATAVETSKNWDSASTVVLVSGANDKMVDGLAATPLAAQLDAPVLLTKADEVPQIVIDEIKRLGATNVVIVGGTGAVSEAVETKLNKTYGFEVERLAGNSRYETSLAVANRMALEKSNPDTPNEVTVDEKFDEVFVVGGKGEADALSASAIAGIKEVPILLTPASELNADVKGFINKYVNDDNTNADVFIVGGESSVNTSVQNELVNLSVFSNGNKIEVKRLAGEGRQETNAEVISHFATDADDIVVAKSSNAGLVDALSAGAYAAQNGAHIVLASNELTESQEDALAKVVENAASTNKAQIGYNVSSAVAKFIAKLTK